MTPEKAQKIVDRYHDLIAAAKGEFEDGEVDENKLKSNLQRIDSLALQARDILAGTHGSGPIPNDTSTLTAGGSSSDLKTYGKAALHQGMASLLAVPANTPIVRQLAVDLPEYVGGKIGPSKYNPLPQPGDTDRFIASAPDPMSANVLGMTAPMVLSGGTSSLAGPAKALLAPTEKIGQAGATLAKQVPVLGKTAVAQGVGAGTAIAGTNALATELGAAANNALPGNKVERKTSSELYDELVGGAVFGGALGGAATAHEMATSPKSYGGKLVDTLMTGEATKAFDNEPILRESMRGEKGIAEVRTRGEQKIVEPAKEKAKAQVEDQMIIEGHREGKALEEFRREAKDIPSRVKTAGEEEVGATAARAEESSRAKLGKNLEGAQAQYEKAMNEVSLEKGDTPIEHRDMLGELGKIRDSFASQSASGKPGQEPVFERMGREVDSVVKDIEKYAGEGKALTLRDLVNLHRSAVKNAQYDSQVTTPTNYAYRQIEKVISDALKRFDPRIEAASDNFRSVAQKNERAHSILYGQDVKKVGDNAPGEAVESAPETTENKKVAGARRLAALGDTGMDAAIKRGQESYLSKEAGLEPEVSSVLGAKRAAEQNMSTAERAASEAISIEELASKQRLQGRRRAVEAEAGEGVKEAEGKAQKLIELKTAKEATKYSPGAIGLGTVALATAGAGHLSPYSKGTAIGKMKHLTLPARATIARYTPERGPALDTAKKATFGNIAKQTLSTSMESMLDKKDEAEIASIKKIPDAVMSKEAKEVKINKIRDKMARRKAAMIAKGK